jgi:hypothetical protein
LSLIERSRLKCHGPYSDEMDELIEDNLVLLGEFLGEGNLCRQRARGRLQEVPTLHRSMYAVQTPDGGWMVGVAVRLDDGGIASLVATGINLDPFTIARWCDEESFGERAAVREYDGGQLRPACELLACLDLIKSANRLDARG